MDDLIRPECEHRFVDPAPLPRDEMAEIAKALGHANRLCIIEQFFDGRAHTAGEIVSACDVAQSTTSEHLRVLRDAGVLRSSRDGPHVWYCLDRPDRTRQAHARSGRGDGAGSVQARSGQNRIRGPNQRACPNRCWRVGHA